MSRLTDLLHQCWVQAKESPEYDKAKWRELQMRVEWLERVRERSAEVCRTWESEWDCSRTPGHPLMADAVATLDETVWPDGKDEP